MSQGHLSRDTDQWLLVILALGLARFCYYVFWSYKRSVQDIFYLLGLQSVHEKKSKRCCSSKLHQNKLREKSQVMLVVMADLRPWLIQCVSCRLNFFHYWDWDIFQRLDFCSSHTSITGFKQNYSRSRTYTSKSKRRRKFLCLRDSGTMLRAEKLGIHEINYSTFEGSHRNTCLSLYDLWFSSVGASKIRPHARVCSSFGGLLMTDDCGPCQGR